MDEGETKTCENCKREIPAVNFTIHAVHCARNIGVCPVCKEPVQLAQLQQHHDAMHKLSPCQQCGEGVCGTDLEDHVRDSCAHTLKTCRFCALELRRGSLPPHERYCGARTERCADCGEWVMHKYRALHLDSNHGFVRLTDDPEPNESATNKTNAPKPSSSNNASVLPDYRFPNSHDAHRPLEGTRIPTATSHRNEPASIPRTKPQNVSSSKPQTNGSVANLVTKRQINGSSAEPGTSRPASGPAAAPGAADAPSRPRAKRSNHQPQLNACAAPPDKVDKELWAARGAVKKRPAPQPPAPRPPAAAEPRGERAPRDPPAEAEAERRRLGLRDLKPMSAEQFARRYGELRDPAAAAPPAAPPAAPADRFSQIKSSLRELRRGLNEVTAPYTLGGGGEVRLPCEFCGAPVAADDLVQHQTGCRPDLTQYRPASRPRSRPASRPESRAASRPESRGSSRAASPAPVIPCEFCTEPLPLYLINDHQERCGRDANLLFPD